MAYVLTSSVLFCIIIRPNKLSCNRRLLVSGSRDAAVEKLTLEDLPDPVYQDQLCQVHQHINDAN